MRRKKWLSDDCLTLTLSFELFGTKKIGCFQTGRYIWTRAKNPFCSRAKGKSEYRRYGLIDLSAANALPNDFSTSEGHVIVAGFGRVGRAVAHILEREKAEIVGLDTNPGTVSKQRQSGRQVYFGDGGRAEVLQKAGLAHASMVVVTLDNQFSAESMVKTARSSRPDVPILARARDADHAQLLYKAGATYLARSAERARRCW